MDEILQKYPNDVKVVIKNFPLTSHKQARKAAQYALAAHKQGKFSEMYHMIHANFRELRNNEDLPQQYASKLGLDVKKLIRDSKSKEIDNLINWEYNQLKEMRWAYPETDNYKFRLAVPKFFINGKEPLSRTLGSFSNLIDQIRPSGIDRIVPIGRTMDFSLNWDGYNLINTLSREIEII